MKILHMEDDPLASETVGAVLRRDGLAVEMDRVETMAEFQQALEQKPYELVLSDFTIPGVDSLEALRWARQRRPEVPFIFVSGTIGEDQAIETLKLGASDYVLKQRLARLTPAVRRALEEAQEQSRRKQAQAEAHLFKFFSENANDGHLLVDYGARIRYANKLVCERLGYTRQEVLQLTIPEIDPAFPLAKVQELFARLQNGRVPPFEGIHRRKDGSSFPVEISCTVLKVDGELLLFSAVREITERKQAEQAKQENERRVRVLFEKAGVGIVEVAGEDHFIAVNARACEILGRTRDELLQLNVRELTWPEDRELSDRLNAEVHAGARERVAYEKRYIRGDGSPVWVNVTVSGVRDNEGRWVRSITTIEDVTERKRAEETLRKTTSLLQAISDNTADTIFAKDCCGRLTFANPATLALVGTSLEQVLGKTDEEFLQDKAAARAVMENDRRIMESGVAEDLEEVVPLPDGTRRVWFSRKIPFRGAGGQVLGLLGISRDITERKQAEEALRQTEQRYRSFVEASAQVVWTTNARGEVNLEIPAWYAYTGQNAAQARAFGWMEAIHPEDRQRVTTAWARAFASRGIYEVNYRLRRHDGAWRYILARGVPVFESAGIVREYVGTCIDMTERKAAEDALRKSEARLNGIISSAMDAIISINTEQRVVLFNAAAERMFATRTADALGKHITHFIPARFREAHVHQVESFGRSGVTSRSMGHLGALSAQRANGEEFPIEASISQIELEGEKLFTVILRDISARIRAEEALRASEQRFRQLADAMPQIVWAARPDGSLDYYNRKWYELTGGKPGENGDESWLPVLHPEERQRCLDVWYESVRTGQPYEIEYRFKFPGAGEYRWHLGRALPVRNEQGDIVRWFGTSTDIHELKRTEAALSEARNGLERTVAERTAQLVEAN
ncbi:MAG TPA: PAS domain S-box protein, partial [Candidatus Sulfotelmatobacter sp.]|nr:PAS domain S-box protein [Candidatus Sulfotelmatobacter sp.]